MDPLEHRPGAAVTEGVKRMLKGSRKEFRYCRDQRGDGCNPFVGVKAYPVEEEPS